MKNKYLKNKHRSGFSLIESILAVAVLSLGIVGVIPLMSAGLNEAMKSRDQMTAAMLAQEGIEIIQNIRDNNWAAGRSSFSTETFPAFSSPLPSNKTNCIVNYDTKDVDDSNCGVAVPGKTELFIKNDYYMHTSSGTTATKFMRKLDMTLAGLSGAQTLTVTSMVVWSRTDFPAVSDCDTINQCTYASLTLTEWY